MVDDRVWHSSRPALLAVHVAANQPFGAESKHEEVLRIMCRRLPTPCIGPGLQPKGVSLEPLPGGRSMARTFKATPLLGPEELEGAPVVLKIGPRGEIERERSNYDRFVRSLLPVPLRPELFGFIRAGEYAGLYYSFLGGCDGTIDTLTERLQRGDTTAIERVLRSIFDPMRNTWYGSRMIRKETDIAQRYRDRFFSERPGTPETENTFRTYAKRYFNFRYKRGLYMLDGQKFPSLNEALFATEGQRPYHSCILHGDLNSDNIIITRQPERVALVDFQKTGRGHVYEDMVALEASVRINYPPDATFSEVLETERLIALGQLLHDPYARSIRKIRDAATSHFRDIEGVANYHFAVAAIGLRLMQALDLSHIARARITASALWAAKALLHQLSG